MPRPRLTDRRALAAHRARAKRMNIDDSLFLHVEAIDEIKERIAEVNRSFTRIAIVSGHPEIWGRAFPGAVVVPDNDRLDLPQGSFDLVIHAMALHWADDPIGQLVQARLALVPDGLLLAVAPGGETLFELRTALIEAETRLRAGLSPRVLPMGELRAMGALLQRAGLALPVADLSARTVAYRDLFALMRDLRAMGETNALATRDPKPCPRRMFLEADAICRSRFPMEGGRLRATFDLVFLTGWAPSPEQPKPLRPGSASTRLAEALGVAELDPVAEPDKDAGPT